MFLWNLVELTFKAAAGGSFYTSGFRQNCICSWCQSGAKAGQELIQVVYKGSMVRISSERTQDRVCGYTGLTSGLNDLQTNLLPRQLNSL